MVLVADTHVHLYPCYELAAALGQGHRNLRALAARARRLPAPQEGQVGDGVTFALGLVEGAGYHRFRELREERLRLPPPFGVCPGAEPETLVVSGSGFGALHLVAGRQIVSRERLEILALGRDFDVADGQPVEDVMAAIRDRGAVPVLNWAPGKWFFTRGRVVARLIDEEVSGQLAVCDTTLRPRIWAEPRLMRRACARGLPRIAGSDPLPFAGEERHIGTYGIVAETTAPDDAPAAALRGLLAGSGAAIQVVGRRLCLMTVMRRLNRHRRARRKMHLE